MELLKAKVYENIILRDFFYCVDKYGLKDPKTISVLNWKRTKKIVLYLASLVAGGAVALRLREVVDVDVHRAGARDDLAPLDGLDVAEVVVVQDTHRPVQNI